MFEKVTQLLEEELEKGTFPGAVIGIVDQGGLIYKKAVGYAQLEPEKREIGKDTVFGLASLTKVISTTSALMKLIEEGQLNLWDYLKEYYPELPEDKEEITIYHLLTHTSGYQAIVELWEMGLSYQEKIEYILNLPLENEIGQVVTYSDPNFILLGDLVRRVSGVPLDQYVRDNIFRPLGMETTDYNPLENLPDLEKEDYAATEECSWRGRMVIGEVHDENCYSFSGVTGHAGLFSTIDDLAIFMEMLLNDGIYQDIRIFSPPTIGLMSREWTTGLNQTRGLGWD